MNSQPYFTHFIKIDIVTEEATVMNLPKQIFIFDCILCANIVHLQIGYSLQ